VHISKE